MVNSEQSSTFVMVPCRCGKTLRARVELAGTEIRCWDCQRTVLVPIPNQAGRVARELSHGALDVIRGPGANSVLMATLVITAVMTIPIVGTWASILAWSLAASAYGETIRRTSRGPTDDPDPSWWAALLPRSIVGGLLCLAMAAGLVYPLWIRGAVAHEPGRRSPSLDAVGLAILAATWLVVPPLMMLVRGRSGEGRIEPSALLKTIARHPMATAAALLMVPLAAILFEVILVSVVYISGQLPTFAIDFMPTPPSLGPPIVAEGGAFFRHLDYRDYPVGIYEREFIRQARRGYTFSGSIPASLANSTRLGVEAPLAEMIPGVYHIARFLIAMALVACLLSAYAIQARWLGSLLGLGRKRPRPVDDPNASGSTGLFRVLGAPGSGSTGAFQTLAPPPGSGATGTFRSLSPPNESGETGTFRTPNPPASPPPTDAPPNG